MTTDPLRILAGARQVLVHNWPSTDVPESLARAGLEVSVIGGPAPDDISVTEVVDGEISSRRTGVLPEHVDVLYLLPWPGFTIERDLPGAVATAAGRGATTFWYQSALGPDGSWDDRGTWVSEELSELIRGIAREAGLRTVLDAYIADVARDLDPGPAGARAPAPR